MIGQRRHQRMIRVLTFVAFLFAAGCGKKAADVSFPVASFFDECVQDRSAAEKKYKGKQIELHGTVDGFGRGAEAGALNGKPYLIFKIGTGKFIKVHTADAEPWASIFPGQDVTVQGQWAILQMDQSAQGNTFPGLVDAQVTAKGTSPRVDIVGADVAREFANEPQKANDKYVGKWFVLTAEFVKPDKNNMIQLKGHGDVHFLGGSPNAEWNVSSLQPGQKVKLVGKCSSFRDDSKAITFSPSFIITKEG